MRRGRRVRGRMRRSWNREKGEKHERREKGFGGLCAVVAGYAVACGGVGTLKRLKSVKDVKRVLGACEPRSQGVWSQGARSHVAEDLDLIVEV